MKTQFLCAIVLFITATSSQGQDIQLTGKIVNQASAPLEGVSVGIERYGLFTLSDAGGSFNLSGPANSLLGFLNEPFEGLPSLQSQSLIFQLKRPNLVSLVLYDLNGQRIAQVNNAFSQGEHRVNLLSAFPGAGTGIHFIRISTGGKTTTLKHTFLTNSTSKSEAFRSDAKSPSMLAKTAANPGGLDTVSVKMAGYISRNITVDSLRKNLGTLVLSPEVNGAPFSIVFDSKSTQQIFGVTRLAQTLRKKNLLPVLVDATQAVGNENLNVAIVDAKSSSTLKKEGFHLSNAAGKLGVTAIDQSGAMYGLLELSDMISIHGPGAVPEKTVNPRFPFRAMKFNTPWSSYRKHESLQLHMETAGDIQYWEGFLDMMAENRLNVLSLWSMHPFPYLVRPTNYPKASPYNDAELAKWQKFWTALFRMAKERGIETYLVNWNIWVTKEFKDNYDKNANEDFKDNFSHGPANNSAVIEKYTRESVTQVLKEYPDLTGLGISHGEAMGSMTPTERQRWVERVIIAGMKAANRPVKLIHRAPLSGTSSPGGSTNRETELMTRQALEAMDFDSPIWVEVKFNWSHGLSSEKLVKVHGGDIRDTYWNPLPKNYAMTWMIRNEDIFVLRWGQPDFIRKHISLNGQDYVGGYFIGSETYIPAKDYLHKAGHAHVDWKYAWERQWLFYKQWGRLLYDPKTTDAVFALDFDNRYGQGVGAKMVDAFRLASNMPLRFAAYVDYTWDGTLYSEGFLAPSLKFGLNDGQSPFLSIRELMDHEVMDPAYISVKDYVGALQKGNLNPSKITPLQLADELQQMGQQALAIVNGLSSSHKTLECEIMDVKALSHLSLYFADKLRAAVALETFRVARTASEKTKAVTLLETAKSHWVEVIAVTKPHHNTIPLLHTGNTGFSWEVYLKEVERDITTAKGL